MNIRPEIFKGLPVIAAQSMRLGGVSPVPFESMNLGLSVNDDEQNVWKNRELFFGGLGIEILQLAKSHQVHGTNVHVANAAGSVEGFDAQISNKPGIFLIASVADCTPILIYDTKNKAVAAIHAGWKGTVGGIVRNTLLKMQQEYGTIGTDCKAFIGACISYKNFEVGDDVAQHFDVSLKRFDAEKQKWFVDLKAANKAQLLAFGLKEENIEVSEYCTVENNDLFFSHRKEKGKTGRMMVVIGMI
ncbi:MAG: pgeF [Bacteroidetes bacterium]|nr:pgeF [Bacteroidota bacterium]